MTARKIKIEAGGVKVIADLVDKNPKTAEAIWNALPFEAGANRWGDEIYFGIPVEVKAENPQVAVEVGDIAYWLATPTFCIFFGKTPANRGDGIRAYSEVNVFAKIVGDAKVLKKVKDGEVVRVERLNLVVIKKE